MTSHESRVADVDVPKHSLFSMTSAPSGKTDNRVEHDETLHRSLDSRAMTMIPAANSRRHKRAPESLINVICRWTVNHQIGLSLNLLLLHALTHLCLPRARETTQKFYRLSYLDPRTGRYAAGWDDFYMVLYSIIVLTGLRAAALDYLLLPMAQGFGIRKKMDRLRFAEQGWILIYDSCIWSLGMYIMSQHEHWMNMRELWSHWPDREIAGTMKWYYLVQFSFWLQQIMIVNIEKRRKDHWQMFSHHVITCILMFTSYAYHWTKVGNLILCLMDIVDVFLALAKILKYIGYRLACDVAFGVFMVVWFMTRHVLYLNIIVSIFRDLPHKISYGCYSGGNANLKGPFDVSDPNRYLMEPFINPTGTICFTPNIKWAFINTLLSLQVILLIWFVMITKVAIKVLRGGEAEDVRSDEEDMNDMENDEHQIGRDELSKSDSSGHRSPQQVSGNEKKVARQDRPEAPRVFQSSPIPIEEEVDISQLHFNKSMRSSSSKPLRMFRKTGSSSSGMSLHSDRKELLGRIGCDGGRDDE